MSIFIPQPIFNLFMETYIDTSTDDMVNIFRAVARYVLAYSEHCITITY